MPIIPKIIEEPITVVLQRRIDFLEKKLIKQEEKINEILKLLESEECE